MIIIIWTIQYLSFRICDSLFLICKNRAALLQSHRIKKRNWIQVWRQTNKSLCCNTFVTLRKKIQVMIMRTQKQKEKQLKTWLKIQINPINVMLELHLNHINFQNSVFWFSVQVIYTRGCCKRFQIPWLLFSPHWNMAIMMSLLKI